MKANELRIGNLIYGVSDRIETVIGLGSDTISAYPGKLVDAQMFFTEDDFTPIPLTEERLIEFGFEERLGGRFFKHTWFYIDQDCAGVSGWYFRSIDGFKAKCEYIHQLQNLYFALTGEELNKQD